MKKIIFVLAASIFISCNNFSETTIEQFGIAEGKKKNLSNLSSLKEGDIIFQSSSGGQGKAIQIATGSKYSHVGIVYKKDSKLYVLEAVQPVKVTPLKEFIERGDNDHYIVKRLKNAEALLTADILKKMKSEGKKHVGKKYDLYFGWSDDRIYCSELVWKIYKRTLNIELGKLQKLKDFNLSNPIVQYKLKERYGNNIPYEEEVISPSAIFDSEKLMEVLRN